MKKNNQLTNVRNLSELSHGKTQPQVFHRAGYDFGPVRLEAKTTYGIIGIQVWIYKGEVQQERAARA